MKTRISAFCDEYLSVLPAIANSIGEASGRIEGESRQDVLDRLQAVLANAGHRFGSLAEKIEHQQAYLIIFGPLKSGKSTLMNTISGNYVSEVSSMPAYPCLVYVSHGEEPGFSAIKYNGSSQHFGDRQGLQGVLDESHAHLADRIRMHELEGEEFDPRVHYTEAVRRIDVKAPVPALKEANTVLVDTPGLYSRMKFGYDLMTREFRDSAACAVFVVKPDTLFLEQVFTEFSQLLNIFSRIFLVVNVDSSKRDLQPDGSLAPSVESNDPGQIVEAFKSLSMTAPLRDAYDAGRLQIYPIDLLSAAEASLKGEDSPSEGTSNFDAFVSDLTGYLNSSDYHLEFERDSLRQGGNLCEQIREACDLDKAEKFQRERSGQERIREELTTLIAVIDETSKSGVKAAFDRASSVCEKEASANAKAAGDALRDQLGKALTRWMDNDESLQTLLHRWNKVVDLECEKVALSLPNSLVRNFDTPTGGADFEAGLMGQLDKVDLDPGGCAQPFVQKLRELGKPGWEFLSFETERVPVRRFVFDWVLLRPMRKVRERLFGPADAPNEPIPSALKLSRLEGKGFAEFKSAIDEFLTRNFPAPQGEFIATHAGDYISKFAEAFMAELANVRSEAANHLQTTEERIAGDQRIIDAVDRLKAEAESLEKHIGAMVATYSEEPGLEGEELVEAEGEAVTSSDQEAAEANLDLPESDNPVESEHPAVLGSNMEMEAPIVDGELAGVEDSEKEEIEEVVGV